MRDLLRADPKQMASQTELCDEWKDCKKAGGQKPRSVFAISEMCKTIWQVARHLNLMNDDSIHHAMGRSFCLEQTYISVLQYFKTKGRVDKLNTLLDIHWIRIERGWKLDW